MGWSVAVDAGRNVLVTGTHGGNLNVGGQVLNNGGQANIFAAKLSSLGEVVWSRGFGEPFLRTAFAVASGADTLLTGGFSGAVELGGGRLVRVATAAALRMCS